LALFTTGVSEKELYKFFAGGKYEVMKYTNIRYRNKAGKPNRMPAFFYHIEKSLGFTEEELANLRAGAYLPDLAKEKGS
jgi:hypothetical protein